MLGGRRLRRVAQERRAAKRSEKVRSGADGRPKGHGEKLPTVRRH